MIKAFRRALRGGAWSSHQVLARAAFRFGSLPHLWFDLLGFRVCCAAPRSPPEEAPSPLVIRGGSWLSDPSGVRSAYRGRLSPGARYDALGFRLASQPTRKPL